MSDMTSGYFSNSGKIDVDTTRYLANLRKAERAEKEKKSPVMNKDSWDYFADFSKNKLVDNIFALSKLLLEEKEISIIGIDIYKDQSFEPMFVVFLPNEYRNDQEFIDTLPKTWAGRLSVVYRIY